MLHNFMLRAVLFVTAKQSIKANEVCLWQVVPSVWFA